VLSALVFVRIGYVYPARTPVLRGLTIALCALWGLMTLAIILMLPDVPPLLLAASLFFPIYYTVLSLVLHARRRSP
jgi:phosphatidylcholine synthase